MEEEQREERPSGQAHILTPPAPPAPDRDRQPEGEERERSQGPDRAVAPATADGAEPAASLGAGPCPGLHLAHAAFADP